MPEYIHTLVATLGGQPQVVTFTLDLLLQRNIPINEVIVVHPDPSDKRLQNSLTRLAAEFVGDTYSIDDRTIRCHLRSHVLYHDGNPLEDIVNDVSANAVLNTIYRLIRDLKQQDRHIHLSVTGGRRLMALMAISAAHLNFDHFDHIWHIYTSYAIRQEANEGALMHVPPEAEVRLIEAPFVPWGAYFPNLVQSVDTAQDMRRSQTVHMDNQEHAKCAKVVARATPRQVEVLKAFARGLEPQEVANELCITISTVDAHKTRLLELCREIWDIEEDARIGYHFLYKTFANYFNKGQYTNPT